MSATVYQARRAQYARYSKALRLNGILPNADADAVLAQLEEMAPAPAQLMAHMDTWPSLEPTSIYQDPVIRELALGTPRSPRKLRLAELSTEKMVISMLLYLRKSSTVAIDAGAAGSSVESAQIWMHDTENLAGLLKKSCQKIDYLIGLSQEPMANHNAIASCTTEWLAYRPMDLISHRSAARQLLQDIEGILGRQPTRKNPLDEKLLKLCSSIATSVVPLDIDCYNAILKGLAPHFDGPVPTMVMHAMYASRIRYNEVTQVCQLDFFRLRDYKNGFNGFLRRFLDQEVHDCGTSDAHFDMGTIKSQDDGCTRKWNKPMHNPLLFHALTRAMMHFRGYDETQTLVRDLQAKGWPACEKVLHVLLFDCAQRADWTNGLSVWHQIKFLLPPSTFEAKGAHTPVFKRRRTILTAVFASMLELCKRCTQLDEYERTWSHACQAGLAHHVLREMHRKTNNELDSLRRNPSRNPIRPRYGGRPDVINDLRRNDDIGLHSTEMVC